MARIRYLHPDFFKDEDVAELSYEARLFFQGLWCYADRAGRLRDSAKRLKVEILPYCNINTEDLLETLSRPKNSSGLPFILRYEIEGQHFIQIMHWDRWQSPHHTEKDSLMPAPLDNRYTCVKTPPKEKEKEKYKEKDKEKEALISCWNKSGLPKVLQLSKARHEKLNQRFVSKHFTENYEESIKKLALSSFALGKSDRGWKVSIDWFLLNDTNYVKALEGKYDDKGQSLIDKYRRL